MNIDEAKVLLIIYFYESIDFDNLTDELFKTLNESSTIFTERMGYEAIKRSDMSPSEKESLTDLMKSARGLLNKFSDKRGVFEK